ncbi:MAG TPA: type IV pilin protein [Povalibacter sp.]
MTTRHRMQGVTLLELMIVVACVAILATVAVANYRGYMIRANRTEARMALLNIQSAQEKFYLQNNQYADSTQLTTAPPAGLGIPAATATGLYTVAITNPTGVDRSFTATASSAGGQLGDVAACRTLTINQDGTRTPADTSGCWK